MDNFNPEDFNGDFIEDLEAKSKILEDFVSFVLGISFKEFQKLRRRFIWEVVPTDLPGRSVLRGTQAFEAFRKQRATDFYYIYGGYEVETLHVARIPITEHCLPDIPAFSRGDYAVAHKNFKWALIRSHEEGEM